MYIYLLSHLLTRFLSHSHHNTRTLHEQIALHLIGPVVLKRKWSQPFGLDSRWQCMQTRKLSCLQNQMAQARRACVYTLYIQYSLNIFIIIVIIGGGASQRMRIADCHCHSDDSKRETQQHGQASVLIACSENYWSSVWVLITAWEPWQGETQELGRDFGDLRTATWHHPGTMGAPLEI